MTIPKRAQCRHDLGPGECICAGLPELVTECEGFMALSGPCTDYPDSDAFMLEMGYRPPIGMKPHEARQLMTLRGKSIPTHADRVREKNVRAAPAEIGNRVSEIRRALQTWNEEGVSYAAVIEQHCSEIEKLLDLLRR